MPLVTHALAERLKARPYALVFGTSRTRTIGREAFGTDVQNFHALYGNPGSIADFLATLEPAQMRNIRQTFMLLDIHIYSDRI